MSQISSITILATGIVFGVLISSIYYNVTGRRTVSNYQRLEKPFFLGVTVTFTTIEGKQYFLKEFDDYAKYVKKYEPTTLSYEVSIHVNNIIAQSIAFVVINIVW